MVTDELIRLRRACALGELLAVPVWLAMGLPRLVLWSSRGWLDRVLALPLLWLAVVGVLAWRQANREARDLATPTPNAGTLITRSTWAQVLFGSMCLSPLEHVDRSWAWALLAMALLGTYLVLLVVSRRAQQRLGVRGVTVWEVLVGRPPRR